MLSRVEYEKLYKLFKDCLDTLVEKSFFCSTAEYREAIGSAVEDVVGVFLFVADQAEKKSEALDLVAKFRSSFSVEEKDVVEEDYGKREYHEILDELNYVRVCIRNICKVDVHDENVDKFQEKITKAKKAHKVPDSLAVFKHALDEDWDVGGNIALFHAHERLNKEINDGSVYIYRTKPRRNVIIKYFISMLSMLGIFASVLSLIFAVKSALSGSDLLGSWSSIVLNIVSFFYFVFSIKNMDKSFHNENLKYTFQRRDIYQIFLVVCGWMSFVSKPLSNIDGGPQKWSVIALFSVLFISFLVHIFCVTFLQPEKDKKLIDSILDKYVQDISEEAYVK